MNNFTPIFIKFIKTIEAFSQMESPSLPPHHLISQGKIHPKSQPSQKNYTPKVIDYRHTIRLITPFQYTEHQSIAALTQKHRLQLKKKDDQIDELLDKIKKKDEALFQKEQQITRLNNYLKKEECSTMTTSIIQNGLDKNQGLELMESFAKYQPHLSFTRASLFSNHMPISQLQISSAVKKTGLNQFEPIEKTISDMAKLTLNNNRKYQFYSEQFKERINPLPLKDNKLFDVANQQTERTDQLEDEFENESTNQSIDTQDFYETMMRQHQYLKEILIELQSSSKKQMQEMKQQYERQISRCQQQLALERQRNSFTKAGPSRYKKVFQAQIQQLKQSRISQKHQLDISSVLKLLNINNKDLNSVLDND